jgi:cell division protein FtsB
VFQSREFCARDVRQVVRTDGLKLIFDAVRAVCYRVSGTEPAVRVYSKARSPVWKSEHGSQTMDFRIKDMAKIRRFPSPEEGLRAVAERAPQAEAIAASWIESVRPLLLELFALRRRIATTAVIALSALLFLHVMLGANGMVVYKQKRAEFQSLQRQIAQEQKENEMYMQQIQALKTDQKAIEKEAREQLRYVRPGEYVYVPPAPANPPASNHSAKK